METTMDCESLRSSVVSRRSLLLGGASFAAWAYLPKFARAADGRDPRLVVVILRGALDGLATVAPIGDPDYAGLHGSIALSSSGPNAALPLDNFFSLHPAMPEFSRMYREKKAAVIHAVATSYRDRSHFDGQDVLESGFAGPGRVQSGWLNRALEGLPKGERVTGGLAVGPTTPLVLRGAAPTVGWAPVALPQAAEDTAMRLLELYQHRDPALASALKQGLALDKAAQGDDMKPKPGTNGVAAMRLQKHHALTPQCAQRLAHRCDADAQRSGRFVEPDERAGPQRPRHVLGDFVGHLLAPHGAPRAGNDFCRCVHSPPFGIRTGCPLTAEAIV